MGNFAVGEERSGAKRLSNACGQAVGLSTGGHCPQPGRDDRMSTVPVPHREPPLPPSVSNARGGLVPRWGPRWISSGELRHERQYRGEQASRAPDGHEGEEVILAEEEVKAYVGIDWATEEHQALAVDLEGMPLDEKVIPHSGEGMATLCDWLMWLADGKPEHVWVGIEIPHGAVVETLLERGFAVFAINPKQMDRFRDRFSPANAKDDRRDAYVIADSLRTDAHCYRRLHVDDALVIELRQWSRMADELSQERTRLSNRVREELRRYFPQALKVDSDVSAPWFLELLERVPTPDKARRVKKQTVAAILKRNRIRKHDAKNVLTTLREKPLEVAPGTTQAATAHLRLLTERLRVVNRQHADCRRQLKDLTERISEELLGVGTDDEEQDEQHDVAILLSMPGIGPVVLAVLLSEAWQAIRERDYQLLRNLSGVAPVTRRSGKSLKVVMRQACNDRLRNALYHWARVASQRDSVTRAQYRALRARGHTHARACRTVGDRLLGVACAMLRDETMYAPELRQASRVKAA